MLVSLCKFHHSSLCTYPIIRPLYAYVTQIFEAEQANLHCEPLVAVKILGDALAHSSILLSSSSKNASDWIRSQVLQHATDSLSLLLNDKGGVEWVGGSTYQKEVFVFLYGSLSALSAVEKQMKQDKQYVSIFDDTFISLLKSVQPAILDGHPGIKLLLQDLHDL